MPSTDLPGDLDKAKCENCKQTIYKCRCEVCVIRRKATNSPSQPHNGLVEISTEELCVFATYYNVGQDKDKDAFRKDFPHLQQALEE